MIKADHYSRTGGGRLIAAMQCLAGFDQREGARRFDAQRFEHFSRENFTNAAFQRQASVAETAIRRLA